MSSCSDPVPPAAQAGPACTLRHTDDFGRPAPCPDAPAEKCQPEPEPEPARVQADPAHPVNPVDEARQLLAAHEAARANECAAAVEALLETYGYELKVLPAQVVLVPAGS